VEGHYQSPLGRLMNPEAGTYSWSFRKTFNGSRS